MTVNGIDESVNVFQTDPAWTNQTCYFKAGNYCQDNSGPTNEVAVVTYYQLTVTHWSASNTQSVNRLAAVNAGGYSSFTPGRDCGNDFETPIRR
jgi:hypothetical protein